MVVAVAQSQGRSVGRLPGWLWLVAAVIGIARIRLGYDKGVISGALRRAATGRRAPGAPRREGLALHRCWPPGAEVVDMLSYMRCKGSVTT
jgi:hypothetical protein